MHGSICPGWLPLCLKGAPLEPLFLYEPRGFRGGRFADTATRSNGRWRVRIRMSRYSYLFFVFENLIQRRYFEEAAIFR